MLIDNEFYEKKQSRVGGMESDWQGSTCSTPDRVIRESLSIRNLTKGGERGNHAESWGARVFQAEGTEGENPSNTCD